MKNMIGHLDYVKIYLDDILVFSPDLTSHVQHLIQVITILHENGASINFDKCKFNQTEIKYLGRIINSTGIRPDTSRVVVDDKFIYPKTKKQCNVFLAS